MNGRLAQSDREFVSAVKDGGHKKRPSMITRIASGKEVEEGFALSALCVSHSRYFMRIKISESQLVHNTEF